MISDIIKMLELTEKYGITSIKQLREFLKICREPDGVELNIYGDKKDWGILQKLASGSPKRNYDGLNLIVKLCGNKNERNRYVLTEKGRKLKTDLSKLLKVEL